MSDQETDVIITVGELAHDRVIGKINLDISGASTAFVNGYCQEKMEIDHSGASDADVTVCSSLNVELSGAQVPSSTELCLTSVILSSTAIPPAAQR